MRLWIGAAKRAKLTAEAENVMKLKLYDIGEGLHPGEVSAKVRSKDGDVEFLVDRQALMEGDGVDVGWPVACVPDRTHYLVELPCDLPTGERRLWVPASELRLQDAKSSAA